MAYKPVTTLLGVDHPLMIECSAQTAMRRYRYAALALIGVIVFTFCSVRYAMDLLFHIPVVEWGLAIFISGLFMLMYILLINTFTKASFSAESAFTLSNMSRFVFILFMAFILSKPAEVFLLKDYNAQLVENHKSAILSSFSEKVAALHGVDLQKMGNRIKGLKAQQLLFPTTDAADEIADLETNIETIHLDEANATGIAKERIDASSFMLYRMQLAGKNGLAWLVCFAVIGLFILPGYLIYSLPKDDVYVVEKKKKEHEKIQLEFEAFLKEYRRVFSDIGYPKITYSTPFADPPFNTIRKGKKTYAGNDSFLDKYGPLY